MELKLTVDGLEKERDFYFSKLRDIELICQEHESESNPILSRIIDILYATEVQPMLPTTNPRCSAPLQIIQPFTDINDNKKLVSF